MKIALAQINTTPGNFSGNFQRIAIAIREAGNKGTDLLVFPELAICGYLSADLLYRSGYIEQNLKQLQEIAERSTAYPNMHIVIGYAGWNSTGSGKPFTNSAAVIRNGSIIATYHKRLLPFYDVFDEGRYYEPGNSPCVIKIGKYRCGILICEDLWNDKGQDDYNHKINPVKEYKELGCKVLISLNSSPFTALKPRRRIEMLKAIATEHNVTIAYCNQIGAQDELIFDGHSVVIHEKREIAFSEDWKEELVDVDLEECGGLADRISPLLGTLYDLEKLFINALVLGLRDYIKKSGFSQVVLGSSGGIDSAVVAALACKAIGPENVHCIMMPSKWSSQGSVEDAKQLHKNLGCKEYLIPIEYESFLHKINCGFGFEELEKLAPADSSEAGKGVYKKLVNYHPVADENIQARMRGQIVMHFSNATGALPLTTGNKTELALGYCTLYGDMNGGFNPLCDLYKLEVYNVARWLFSENGMLLIPQAIIRKPPSAELAPNQTDEQGLKVSYSVLDIIVKLYIEEHVADYPTFSRLVKRQRQLWSTKTQAEEVEKWLCENNESLYYDIIRRIDIMEYKRRQAAPGLKVSQIAFGTGRRIPIVKELHAIQKHS